MRKRLRVVLSVASVCMVLLAFNFCNPSTTVDRGLDQEIINAEKPVIDSAMVLETLELYRAKRYEGIQEAMKAGVENVHKLVLYGRRMIKLSPEIGSLTYLASLDVANNKLSVLPGEISSLHYLQGFYANGNRLKDFPESILLLPLLEKVDLSGNQIRTIPEEIMKMDQLTRLSLDKNAITSLPVQLYELENLTVLELAHNGLSEIPEGIANLLKLRKLDLSNNQLKSLPKEITTLTETLTELNIQGNQIPQSEIQWFVEAMTRTQIRF